MLAFLYKVYANIPQEKITLTSSIILLEHFSKMKCKDALVSAFNSGQEMRIRNKGLLSFHSEFP